jgi:hypothetical protein
MARYAVSSGATLDKQIFADLETLISSMRAGSKGFEQSMDLATKALAVTSHGFVTKTYRGPRMRAWSQGQGYQRSTFRIPVRQITGRTLAGWRVRRIGVGIWELFNEERGAYMVEYGIVRGGHGVARKPLKMSAVATLRFIQRTRFANRMMADTFGNLRNNKGHFQSFNARMAGSSILGTTGPMNLP